MHVITNCGGDVPGWAGGIAEVSAGPSWTKVKSSQVIFTAGYTENSEDHTPLLDGGPLPQSGSWKQSSISPI